MSKLRFRISMSLDGFVAGPSQSEDDPLGIGGTRLHEWAFALAVVRAQHGLEDGEVDESTLVVEESLAGIGATVMGRNMFGGHPWDPEQPDLHGLELVRTVAAPKVTHLKFTRRSHE